MNKNYTLKELADIAKAAAEKANKESQEVQWGAVMAKADRPGFIWSEAVKAVLDAIGYEFPKDEEREAFERWLAEQGDGFHPCGDVDKAFVVWKAGREELRRSMEPSVCANDPDAKPKEPAWIPWDGGECPLPDTVKKWEFQTRAGYSHMGPAYPVRWKHEGAGGDIVAYRVWEG